MSSLDIAAFPNDEALTPQNIPTEVPSYNHVGNVEQKRGEKVVNGRGLTTRLGVFQPKHFIGFYKLNQAALHHSILEQA